MPYPRASHTAVAHNNIIYVFGGHGTNPSNVFSSVMAFDATLTSIDDLNDIVPEKNKLYQNYPNPFNGITTFEFEINKAGLVSLSIYNTLGQNIAEIENAYFPAGRHQIKWDAVNKTKKSISSGVYLLVLKKENHILKRKITYLK